MFLFVFGLMPFVVTVPVRADVVYGKVTDFARTPLEGVTVTVERGTETVGIVESGTDGYYAVEDCSIAISDVLSLTFVKPKFVASWSGVTVSDSFIAECSEKRLQKGTGTERLLTVNVVSDSDPVPGAKVRFKRSGEYAMIEYSSSLGECFFDRLKDKTYSYVVTCTGYQKLKGTKTVTGDEEIDLELVSE